MAHVNWTFQALEDMEEIAAFHARNSERYASLLVEYFFEGAAQLEKFPLSGRIVPELNTPSIREIIVKRYRIIYAVANTERIEILTVRPSSLPLDL
jgi:toxin ParE1/3/4